MNSLNEWGLPPLIVSWFRKRGVTSLFDWQVEALSKQDVLSGANLVYSAPTSAGKTLVGDLLLLKRVLEYGKKALVIEPFIALTRERACYLKSMLHNTKARVGSFGGAYYTPGGMSAVSVAVCTIEKANNFVNKLINEKKLSDLGIIVVDEIHYLGDDSRGYQLELLLTKIMYYNSQREKRDKIQIVGLSATIPNLETVAVWLDAALYVTEYRPVPLIEKIKIDNKIFNVIDYVNNPSAEPLETLQPKLYSIDKDFDDVFYLCIQSTLEGFSTLIFCQSKRECEILATGLAEQIKITGSKIDNKNQSIAETSKNLRQKISADKIKEVLLKLKKCPAGADKDLVKALNFGVAFHHAGLTSEEREIIEDGFKSGAIKSLMATSTLSSGVNLPARRVIIRSPTMISTSSSTYQKEMLNPITYKQMIGRAGRKNIDLCGESILICNPETKDTAIKLVKSTLSDISSALGRRMMVSEEEPGGLKKALLEVIANGTAQTILHINNYLKLSFWLFCSTRKEENIIKDTVKETLRYLINNKFIEELKPGVYRATRLGIAVLASGLHPDESLELVQDLLKARNGFCLLNDLHIIYQVTPSNIARSVELNDWLHYSKIWNNLDSNYQSVGEKVGIDEVTIVRKCQGYLRSMTESNERIYKKFFVALIINDLISEISLPVICSKYRVTKATVQKAQREVAQFAGLISVFCQELGYDNIAALVKPLESRINFSCQRDLLDLVPLNLTRPIARTLFNSGFKNIISIAKADKLDIEFVIRQAKPFKKDISFTEKDAQPSIWVPELATNMTTLDYASHIVDTARNHIEVELEIELRPNTLKRKEDESMIEEDSDNDLNRNAAHQNSRIQKRERLENAGSDRDDSIDTREETEMVRANREIPNFVIKYLGPDVRDINKFLDKWIVHSSVSLSFKLVDRVRETIGSKITKPGGSESSQSQPVEGPELSDSTKVTPDNEDEYKQGLKLRLELDNQEQVVTRVYTCFDDELTVYVIRDKQTLKHIRDNLPEYLRRTYSSATAQTNTQRKTDFIPLKLYTKDIVSTYKVLYSAFGLDRRMLNRHFEWHGFDVAWWMVSDCPNRGLNNRNSSLSLVAKTNWATKYHHFLHSSKASPIALQQSPTGQGRAKILKLKDIVKSGKTAILQPLINEILFEIKKRNQLDSYVNAEIPSRLTMAHVMVYGIGIDMKTIRDELGLYDDLCDQLSDISRKYYAKSAICLTNIKDVARVLYDDLDLKKHLLDHSTNSDIAKDPTNGEVLKILAEYHPFPRLVQDFRKIGKAREALQAVNTYSRHNKELDMMRVFGKCDFWQQTGRVSMFDPDLLLINRNFTVTIPEHGNRTEEVVECSPRRCFVPIVDWVLVSADFSQLELRLLAHFSADDNLLSILNRNIDSEETHDVFKSIASNIYQKPIEEISCDQRQRAKQICYGIIYGMGNTSLANQLGVELEDAEQFRQEFFNAFPRISHFTEATIKKCEETGYVESLLGRRRFINGINSANSSLRSRAHRVAINTRIQSSASDIIKCAIKEVNEKILDHFESCTRLVLEMHDELIFEVNPAMLLRFSRMLKFTMENLNLTPELQVKLLVNLKKGVDWSNMDKFSVESQSATLANTNLGGVSETNNK